MKHLFAIILTLSGLSFYAQKLDVKETWVSGRARSIMYTDIYENETQEDTVTSSRLNSGHTLLDLALNVRPSDRMFIHGMIRFRNDHGGFWGSGVTFDARYLYLRGLIGKGFRYQVGDIQYKLTPYTMFNTDEETSRHEPTVFGWMREMNQYDLFFDQENTWRQQGVTGDFTLEFKEFAKELDVTLFTTRLNSSAENGLLDRLQAGGSAYLKQSDLLDFRLTYINAFDILGTSGSTNTYNNPVVTGGFGLHTDAGDWRIDLNTEFGRSEERRTIGEEDNSMEDYFQDVAVLLTNDDNKLSVSLGYQEVGPDFRSIGAQTKRIAFQSAPLAFQRYGNDQNLRPLGMLDILRDASIYNVELRTQLMPYDPTYGNAQPYGRATPNRRNILIGLEWTSSDKLLDVEADGIIGQEVIGTGTAELRSFNTASAAVTGNFHEALDWEKGVSLTLAGWSEQTSRDGGSDFEDIGLDNMMFSLGLDIELVKDLELLAGYRMWTTSGNEQRARLDQFGEIITFQPFDLDSEQQLLAAGIRYNFNDRSFINAQWTNYNFVDNLEMAEDYNISDFSIIYRMIF